jgi:hypothetical protein
MIRETADELRTVAQSCDDAAGYFPDLYSRVTSHFADSIAAHEFTDGDRMNRFATEFASRYIRAWKREIPSIEVLAGIVGREGRAEGERACVTAPTASSPDTMRA